MDRDHDLARARSLVAASSRPLALTGAGVSAESGVPTFRGADGLWRNHRPEELAHVDAFRRDPALVWEFYRWRRDRVRRCVPNAAHHALAAYGRARPGLVLVTQNVDGFHRAAGSPNVIELHGRLMIDRCLDCDFERDEDPHESGIPRCSACGAFLRPGVVWFGEPVTRIGDAFHAAAWADLVLVVGTSGVVEPAASIARVASRRGAAVIEVNVEPSALSSIADVTVLGRAAEVLPALLPNPA